MTSDIGALLAKLNSPSDWFFVLGAGLAGFVVDGAINIVPLPFFSPGICAFTAGSATLAVKRGIEATVDEKRRRRRARILSREAQHCVTELEDRGDHDAARDLSFEVELAGGDVVALETVVRDARARRSIYARQSYLVGGALAERYASLAGDQNPEE